MPRFEGINMAEDPAERDTGMCLTSPKLQTSRTFTDCNSQTLATETRVCLTDDCNTLAGM